AREGLPCDRVHWAIEDDAHAFWLFTTCGLVRVAREELESGRVQRTSVYDSGDGVRLVASIGSYHPLVSKSADGRIWFRTVAGVSVIDPRRLPFNPVPPPVHIERVAADRTNYDAGSAGTPVRLPALTRDLQVDYTALSFVAPEKVRFRYQLEGFDRDWQDVGNRRQALYTNLPPGRYRFRVSAQQQRRGERGRRVRRLLDRPGVLPDSVVPRRGDPHRADAALGDLSVPPPHGGV